MIDIDSLLTLAVGMLAGSIIIWEAIKTGSSEEDENEAPGVSAEGP